MARKNRNNNAPAPVVVAPEAELEPTTAPVVVAPAVEPELATPAVDPVDATVAALTQTCPETGAVQWQPKPRYAVSMSNAVAPAATPATVVLVKVLNATPKQGTASAAAYNALVGSMGKPKDEVLNAVAKAELEWHRARGRTPAGVRPAGWFAKYKADFGPAPAAE